MSDFMRLNLFWYNSLYTVSTNELDHNVKLGVFFVDSVKKHRDELKL